MYTHHDPRSQISSSFTTTRVNKTTFVVREDDAYNENPLIYIKLHPTLPIAIITDTGCDEPSSQHKHARYTHLRSYLEHCPNPCTPNNRPINPGGARTYIIILTHCHYDHLSGISQFLSAAVRPRAGVGKTQIIASAAGRDFITSDLETNGLFKYVDKAVPPSFHVTHWTQAFERLTYDDDDDGRCYDLGVTVLQTPGHTPDSLAWYDHDEMHLYVGDSFYQGEIVWAVGGNLIEWAFSMEKVRAFVRGENAKAAAAAAVVLVEAAGEEHEDEDEEDEEGWVQVARRVKVGSGHENYSVDALDLLTRLEKFWWATLRGDVPIVEKQYLYGGEAVYTWREKNVESGMSFRAPARLMYQARDFFEGAGAFDRCSGSGFVRT